jgi:hypothetical protein
MNLGLEANCAIVCELRVFSLHLTLRLVRIVESEHMQMVRYTNCHLFELRDPGQGNLPVTQFYDSFESSNLNAIRCPQTGRYI